MRKRALLLGGAKAPGGELFGIVSAAAADDQRRFSSSLVDLACRNPQSAARVAVRPRNRALPLLGFAVESFEPAGVAPAMEFGGEFARVDGPSCSEL